MRPQSSKEIWVMSLVNIYPENSVLKTLYLAHCCLWHTAPTKDRGHIASQSISMDESHSRTFYTKINFCKHWLRFGLKSLFLGVLSLTATLSSFRPADICSVFIIFTYPCFLFLLYLLNYIAFFFPVDTTISIRYYKCTHSSKIFQLFLQQDKKENNYIKRFKYFSSIIILKNPLRIVLFFF